MPLLDDFIAAHRHTPFQWGANDCCTVAADWVLVKTGGDPMHDLRGLDSALQAMRRLRALGGFRAAGAARLGSEIPRLTAAVGDVCLVHSGRRIGRASGYSFGVCTGRLIAAPALDGLAFTPITEAVAAWHV